MITGLRFAPGTAPTVLGIPARELRDQPHLAREVKALSGVPLGRLRS